MSRRLDDLAPSLFPKAVMFLARLVEAKIPVLVTDTRRSEAEQADAVKRGVSWTMHSKHLTGQAIDVAPYNQYALHGKRSVTWDDTEPVWQEIGRIGQSCGLKWGVMRNGKRIDLGHFEEGT